MTRTVAPYGTWKSPVTSALLVERSVQLADVTTSNGYVFWNELRPSEGGRNVVVASASLHSRDGASPGRDLLPPGFSARTQVHEYGGRCFTFASGSLVASNWEDQRLWRFAGGTPEPLTPEPPAPRALRYADPVVTPDGQWVICVRERHLADQVINELVAVSLESAGEPVVLATGHDFYSAPAVSPDGDQLAWLSWDHPNMPWDGTELWEASLAPGARLYAERLVAGGPDESVAQPRWSPAGELHWVSDRTGWWNIYANGRPLCPMEAEFNEPGWVFGTSTYTFLPDGKLVATWSGPAGPGLGGPGLGVVEGGKVDPIEPEESYTGFTSLAPDGDGVACVASSPAIAPQVVRIALGGHVEVLRRSREVEVDRAYLSLPERVSYPTGDGEVAYALLYPPTNPDFEAPDGEKPPLVVISHGGPTGAARPALNLSIQFFTSRGFMVADADYRGSAGYGRAYRNRLRDNWGICDVEDCAGVGRWLADQGRVDPQRRIIRGGSAGGFTTLASLAFTDVFAAGASHYGVADLAALARETHKFESRYLDRLVGPWPEAEDVYRARSPIEHLEGFSCPLILFQGQEDVVVPPAQSEMVRDAVAAKGLPVCYLAFEGEQHGFRRAENIQRAAAAELTFYGLVFGFTPDEVTDIDVVNAGALPVLP